MEKAGSVVGQFASEEARLAALLDAQREIAGANVGSTALEHLVLERMSRLTGADGASLEVTEGDEMVYAAATGLAAAFVGLRLKTVGSLSGYCLTSGQLQRAENVETDPRVDRDACRRIGLRSMILIPLRYNERSFGVLKLMSRKVGAFDAGVERTLRLMGEFLSATIGRRRAEEALREREAALRERDERMSVLLANLHSGVALVDERGRFVLHNASFARIFGLSSEIGDVNDQQWGRWQVYSEDGQLLHLDEHPVRKAAFSGKPVRDQLVRIKRPSDGQELWLLVCAEPILGPEGRLSLMICTFYDITERKQAEEALKAAMASAEQAKAVAEAASRAKDEFIAVLSHELRTPLAPVVGALSLLQKDGRLPADVLEDLNVMGRNLDLEVRLIADLLDVSRITAKKLHLEKAALDAADAIREAAKIVAADLEGRRQTLVIELSGAPYAMFGDRARLQQVFWNLLRNSIKFSPEGGRIVMRARVEVEEGAARKGWLVVEVIDEGMGIAPEILPKLFNAFEQERKARTFGGLGLGLSICKGVVEMHGGTIAAHSDGTGQGATFTVRLPLVQSGTGWARVGESSAKGDGSVGGGRGVRILLVEDHPDTAKLMQRLLTRDGHEVFCAHSVAEGWECFGQCNPELLISDLGLPDGSGMDLMKQIVAAGRRIPAIALSGYGTEEDIRLSQQAGFGEHLVKPLCGMEPIAAAMARLGFGGRSRAS